MSSFPMNSTKYLGPMPTALFYGCVLLLASLPPTPLSISIIQEQRHHEGHCGACPGHCRHCQPHCCCPRQCSCRHSPHTPGADSSGLPRFQDGLPHFVCSSGESVNACQEDSAPAAPPGTAHPQVMPGHTWGEGGDVPSDGASTHPP